MGNTPSSSRSSSPSPSRSSSPLPNPSSSPSSAAAAAVSPRRYTHFEAVTERNRAQQRRRNAIDEAVQALVDLDGEDSPPQTFESMIDSAVLLASPREHKYRRPQTPSLLVRVSDSDSHVSSLCLPHEEEKEEESDEDWSLLLEAFEYGSDHEGEQRGWQEAEWPDAHTFRERFPGEEDRFPPSSTSSSSSASETTQRDETQPGVERRNRFTRGRSEPRPGSSQRPRSADELEAIRASQAHRRAPPNGHVYGPESDTPRRLDGES